MTQLWQKTQRAKNYPRVKLDERQLYRIATIVNETVTPPNTASTLSIDVISADGEQKLQFQDPSVFLGDKLPSKIGKVSIHAGIPEYYPAAANISFDASRWTAGALLSVEGRKPESVHSLFHELNREMEAAQIGNDRLVAVLKWAVYAITVMAAVSLTIACLATAANVLKSKPTDTWQSWMVLASFAVAILVGMATSNRVFVRANSYVSSAFPAVEFGGRLADPGLGIRSKLNWALAIVIVPALVALFVWILTVAISAIAAPSPPK